MKLVALVANGMALEIVCTLEVRERLFSEAFCHAGGA